MSRRSRKRTNWKCNIAWSAMEKIAGIITAEFSYLTEGLILQKYSAVWAKANGLYTVRLVYSADYRANLVFSYTNIAIGRRFLEAV